MITLLAGGPIGLDEKPSKQSDEDDIWMSLVSSDAAHKEMAAARAAVVYGMIIDS